MSLPTKPIGTIKAFPASRMGHVQVEVTDGRTLVGKDPYFDPSSQTLMLTDSYGEVAEVPWSKVSRLLRRAPRWPAYAIVGILTAGIVIYTSPRWLATLALAPRPAYLLGTIAGAMAGALVVWLLQDLPGMWQWKEDSTSADA